MQNISCWFFVCVLQAEEYFMRARPGQYFMGRRLMVGRKDKQSPILLQEKQIESIIVLRQ